MEHTLSLLLNNAPRPPASSINNLLSSTRYVRLCVRAYVCGVRARLRVFYIVNSKKSSEKNRKDFFFLSITNFFCVKNRNIHRCSSTVSASASPLHLLHPLPPPPVPFKPPARKDNKSANSHQKQIGFFPFFSNEFFHLIWFYSPLLFRPAAPPGCREGTDEN